MALALTDCWAAWLMSNTLLHEETVAGPSRHLSGTNLDQSESGKADKTVQHHSPKGRSFRSASGDAASPGGARLHCKAPGWNGMTNIADLDCAWHVDSRARDSQLAAAGNL